MTQTGYIVHKLDARISNLSVGVSKDSGGNKNGNPTVGDPINVGIVADSQKFQKDGFVKIEDCLGNEFIDCLNDRLEKVLRGEFNTGTCPDKTPKLIKGARKGPIGFSGNTQGVKVLQVINIWKSDETFKQLVTSPKLGTLVAQLAGWKHGARVAQDQVWAKPPGAAPLVFHRDSPYFFFTPSDVVTVWVALDDMDEELGPLEYVKGSHRWGDGRIGSSNMFFQRDAFSLLHSASEKEGIDPDSLEIESMSGLKRGGISVHNGLTWHGSKKNMSKTRPRRGLGIHFIPGNAKFHEGASKSSLWKNYSHNPDGKLLDHLPEDLYPLTGTAVED
eukprot:CAMPEP_0204827894 /NCGR_PEP_ID=MMETSP1346-20131115/5419_1 /ASSEMBLY_ACC=CAM_ASM_000771 /TAXON_ID=215587 /ORGANISM="Aplanochytrium stocchinoi, Strain GSBS06" /LENGTH=331 /DNA_ID=CAMNT_0051956561 /DNA_START=401 /DNA_END=1396 /DNA_ORIENTATION=-